MRAVDDDQATCASVGGARLGLPGLLNLLLLLAFVSSSSSLKPIKFASSIKCRSSSFSARPDKPLRQWFSEPAAIATLLGAAETVVKEPNETFRISTRGPAFPGLSVSSENVVRIERPLPTITLLSSSSSSSSSSSTTSSSSSSSSTAAAAKDPETYASLSLVLVDTTLKASGPELLKRIFDATLPDLQLRSLNRVRVVDALEDSSLAILSEVSLTAELNVPSWVPIPVKLLESRGSAAFQGLLDRDVSRLIEKFKNEYLEWAAEG
jgi:hypothetical protein